MFIWFKLSMVRIWRSGVAMLQFKYLLLNCTRMRAKEQIIQPNRIRRHSQTTNYQYWHRNFILVVPNSPHTSNCSLDPVHFCFQSENEKKLIRSDFSVMAQERKSMMSTYQQIWNEHQMMRNEWKKGNLFNSVDE